MDDEDFVFITDREKDMIIRGGENIVFQEVEAVIYDKARHPVRTHGAVLPTFAYVYTRYTKLHHLVDRGSG